MGVAAGPVAVDFQYVSTEPPTSNLAPLKGSTTNAAKAIYAKWPIREKKKKKLANGEFFLLT